MDLSNYLNTATQIINDPTIKANAAITFNGIIDDDEITFEEDEVGNLIPSEADREDIVLECWLIQTKPPMSDVQAGVNLDSEYFKGRLVNPKTYNFPIKAAGDISVTINGRTGMVTQLIVLESPASVQYNIKDYLGQKIAMYVQFSQGN